jgi:hypothetical protein
MNKNYNELLTRLNARVNPEGIQINKSFSSELGRIPQRGIFQYIKKAMQGVEPAYTQRSLEAGRKVRDKLKAELSDVQFDFQGSVMTNTHIKGYSDIDLLTVCNKFYMFDRAGINEVLNSFEKTFYLTNTQKSRLQIASQGGGYVGALNDLRALRLDDERILQKHYSYVDISKPKSIKVSMTNPKREVDVVVANWYKDADYYISNDKTHLGVKIFEKGNAANQDKQLPPDYPFLSIARINSKDSEVNGRLKKMIRFLKTVKGDSGQSDSIKLSSFDFNAICYDIDKSTYEEQAYIDLVVTVYNQLNTLATNPIHRNRLKSVDGYEFIFRNKDGSENTEKVVSLQTIISEVGLILNDIAEENRNLRFAV